jgi:transposase-like protein
MLEENHEPLSGRVEVDETYCGGYRRGGKKGRAASAHKTIVAGAVERQGHVIAKVIPDIFTRTLEPFVQEKVLSASVVYTDEHSSYRNLNSLGYDHRRIHHTQKVYVIGDR